MKKKLIRGIVNCQLSIVNSHIEALFMLSLSEKLLLTDWAVSHGIKVFWVEHDRVGRWLRWNPWLPQLRRLSKLATTICVSELSRKIFVDLGWDPEKVVAIANGVDTSRFKSEESYKLQATRPNGMAGRASYKLSIGCLARLSPEKGVDVLLQAIADMPEVSLRIVGTGPEEGYLIKLMQQIEDHEGGQKRITIKPHINDLAGFYQSCDVLVLPSRDNDPFGLVAAEAMILGVPVIVTDQCGIAGYLQDGVDALIVPADDIRALALAIERMLDSDLRKRIAGLGEETARQKFSIGKMIDAYEKLL